jgi:hypothetical protein
MTHTDTADRTALLVLVAAAGCIEALALLLRPLLAPALALLLTLLSYCRPWPSSPPASAPPAVSAPPVAPLPRCKASAHLQSLCIAPTTQAATEAAGPQLQALPVRELRRLARAAGHRVLARSGRRADLLLALT